MKKGVTLVELLIAMVCVIVMIGVVYQLITITERVHIRTGARAEAEYNIREAMDLMVSELRHAGYRHWNRNDENPQEKPNFLFTLSRIGTESDTHTITFEGDFNEDGTRGDRERISYQFFQGTRTLSRGVSVGTETSWETLANNVENVEFEYRDAHGGTVTPQTQDPDRIRSINIKIAYAPPSKGGKRPSIATLTTHVRLRNTYYRSNVRGGF